MSKEYQIWEMLAGVGNFKDIEPVNDLNDDSLISCISDRLSDESFLILAVQMRERGLLVMKDGDREMANMSVDVVLSLQEALENFGPNFV